MQKFVLTPFREESMVIDDALPEEVVLSAIPQNWVNRAKALLAHIKRSPIDWNCRGELIVNSKVVSGSHISDLLKTALYDYQHLSPVGSDDFFRALSEFNIPVSLVTNLKRRAQLKGIPVNRWLKY